MIAAQTKKACKIFVLQAYGIVERISSAVGYRNRGVKRTNFRVISRVKAQGVSAALLEVCFIDNASDVNIYKSRKNDIANAIVNGVAEDFGLKQQTAETHYAEKYYNKLKGLGYITSDEWKEYNNDLPTAFALSLLDKVTGGTWGSDEADAEPPKSLQKYAVNMFDRNSQSFAEEIARLFLTE